MSGIGGEFQLSPVLKCNTYSVSGIRRMVASPWMQHIAGFYIPKDCVMIHLCKPSASHWLHTKPSSHITLFETLLISLEMHCLLDVWHLPGSCIASSRNWYMCEAAFYWIRPLVHQLSIVYFFRFSIVSGWGLSHHILLNPLNLELPGTESGTFCMEGRCSSSEPWPLTKW